MCIAGMGGLISTSTFKLRHKLIHHWKLDFLLMNGAHTPSTQAFPWTHKDTGTHVHTPIYWSFSQKGRMSCQHIILLFLPYSPPYLWNAFEDDKLLFFDLPTASHLLSHSFLWFSHPSRYIQTYRDVRVEPRL